MLANSSRFFLSYNTSKGINKAYLFFSLLLEDFKVLFVLLPNGLVLLFLSLFVVLLHLAALLLIEFFIEFLLGSDLLQAIEFTLLSNGQLVLLLFLVILLLVENVFIEIIIILNVLLLVVLQSFQINNAITTTILIKVRIVIKIFVF